MPEVIVRAVAPAAVHRVLAIPGGAPPRRLMDLARCSTPQCSRMELFTLRPDTDRVEHGGSALMFAVPEREQQPDVRTVLRALHETRADALVLGYPDNAAERGVFSDTLERATAAASLDVVVCVNRHDRPWQRVLVPYLYGPLDRGALGVARRLARSGSAAITILYVVDPDGDDDGMQTLRTAMDGCEIKVVTATDPIAASASEARLGYDLVVLGGRERVVHGRYFTMRQQRLLLATDATLAIVHSGRHAS